MNDAGAGSAVDATGAAAFDASTCSATDAASGDAAADAAASLPAFLPLKVHLFCRPAEVHYG